MLNVKYMKRFFIILAAGAVLIGCRSGREQGGTGAESINESGASSSTQTNDTQQSNLPGGDVRPNRDGDSAHGIHP
jgi:hypothetical protein